MPHSINNGIMTKGKNINGSDKKADFLTPNVLISVRVPVFLSASTSVISLVIDPPTRNNMAMNPIDKGTGCKELPKTLHAANIPKNPLGMATHN